MLKTQIWRKFVHLAVICLSSLGLSSLAFAGTGSLPQLCATAAETCYFEPANRQERFCNCGKALGLATSNRANIECQLIAASLEQARMGYNVTTALVEKIVAMPAPLDPFGTRVIRDYAVIYSPLNLAEQARLIEHLYQQGEKKCRALK